MTTNDPFDQIFSEHGKIQGSCANNAHPLRTDDCPSIPRFVEVFSGEDCWTAGEQVHVVSCEYCQLMVEIEFKDERRPPVSEITEAMLAGLGVGDVLKMVDAGDPSPEADALRTRLAVGYHCAGREHEKLGEDGAALEAYRAALSSLSAAWENDPESQILVGATHFGIARLLARQNNLEEAISEYSLAVEYQRNWSSPSALANTLLSLAGTQVVSEMIGSAVATAGEAIDVLRSASASPDELAHALIVSGNISVGGGNPLAARPFFEEANLLVNPAPRRDSAELRAIVGSSVRIDGGTPGDVRNAGIRNELPEAHNLADVLGQNHESTNDEKRILTAGASRSSIGQLIRRLGDMLVRSRLIRPGYAFVMIASLLTAVAGALIVLGSPVLAALALVVAMPFETLDADLAQRSRHPRKAVFVDFVSDRFGDIILFGSLAWFYRDSDTAVALGSLAVLSAALMASYIRAQASALAFEGSVGHFGRGLRIIVLAAGLLLGQIAGSLVVIAVATSFVLIGRVHQTLQQAEELDASRWSDEWKRIGAIWELRNRG